MAFLNDVNLIAHFEPDLTHSEDGSRIASVSFKRINFHQLAERIYSMVDRTSNLRLEEVRVIYEALPEEGKRRMGATFLIYRYCVHRLLTHYQLYRSNRWKIRRAHDYYAEDLEGVYLRDEPATHVNRGLLTLQDSSPREQIEFILTLIYGEILDRYRGQDWMVIAIDADQLEYSNPRYKERVASEDLSYLAGYNLPRALCQTVRGPEGLKYRVIDGYHRLAAAPSVGRLWIIATAPPPEES